MEKRTYRQRAEYLKKAVVARRKKIKEKAIKEMGGKCFICGYNKCPQALEFHHLKSSPKNFGLSSKGITHSWDKIRQEIKKCLLLCANCHREIHAGYLQLSEETLIEKSRDNGKVSKKR